MTGRVSSSLVNVARQITSSTPSDHTTTATIARTRPRITCSTVRRKERRLNYEGAVTPGGGVLRHLQLQDELSGEEPGAALPGGRTATRRHPCAESGHKVAAPSERPQ